MFSYTLSLNLCERITMCVCGVICYGLLIFLFEFWIFETKCVGLILFFWFLWLSFESPSESDRVCGPVGVCGGKWVIVFWVFFFWKPKRFEFLYWYGKCLDWFEIELRACLLHFDYLTKFVACEWFFNLAKCDFFFRRKMLNMICEWLLAMWVGKYINTKRQ